jgi:signal peptide peptidase SppA
MRFQHLIEQVYHRPWYITPAGHSAIDRIVRARLLSPTADESAEPAGLNLADLFQQRRPLAIDATGIATIHILGPVGKGLSKMEKQCGATSFEDIRADLAAAEAGGARGILLHFENAPGGTVTGTPETAQAIVDSPLPIVAYTEDLMASAAYYMAAGAKAIVASPSASVGSIGVYIPWVDRGELYAREGLKPDPIVNTGGDLKALGFGGTLTEAQRAYLQETVDEDFAEFAAHVLNYRQVEPSAMRGQTLSGKKALAANLIDAVGDLNTARAELAKLFKP